MITGKGDGTYDDHQDFGDDVAKGDEGGEEVEVVEGSGEGGPGRGGCG